MQTFYVNTDLCLSFATFLMFNILLLALNKTKIDCVIILLSQIRCGAFPANRKPDREETSGLPNAGR